MYKRIDSYKKSIKYRNMKQKLDSMKYESENTHKIRELESKINE